MNGIDFNRLWQNFVDIVTNHYVDFNGRIGRAQFWWYVLVVFLLGIAVSIVGALTTRFLSSLFSLALFLPNLGISVRRLHDVGKPGAYVLLPLVPAVLGILFTVTFLWLFAFFCWIAVLVTSILLIYWYIQPGDPSANQYGPPPPVWTPNGPVATTL